MRNLVLRLAAIAWVVLTLGACADIPTQADQQRAPDLSGPVQTQAPMGCVIEGTCVLPPLIVDGGCDPWMSLDWCQGGDCMTSVPGGTDYQGTMGCPGGGGAPGGGGGGTPPPPPSDPGAICPLSATTTCPPDGEDDEEEGPDTDICPQPVAGKTLTYLVKIAGRNHEFKFTGTMNRVDPLVGRSPAWYGISGPTVSKDSWWIAESGDIQLVCWGRWRFRNTIWLGTIVVQDDDLHMVMGPGHPDF